ncbi:hypothetical protein BO70DRAFT_314743 [Aspergillus heteromorphus CBS 117.55]|uniref:F-box domain-containing protein n=1 Tax=Aspergillus heteromorphus CBS 117.55 TaxID=1448321 RepID=A0A317WD36_9EURO|nr:uncharacterized protein BO70DRAFT_314743 [Aspergillus heteromorphus CBS 117.55]PWY82080.1 hypothetical protein BO70DRAFT_314743 [Aspergillus heteromorphus CBS 117.55]
MHHFCAICGVFISPSQAGLAGAPPESLEWYQILRAVQRMGSLPTAALSGLGYVDALGNITAPPGTGSSFLDENASVQTYAPFYDPETESWTFTIHGLCWEVLLQRIPAGMSDAIRSATVLHDVLYCSTWNRRFLRPGHDFGGAILFQKPVGDPIQAIIRQGYTHLLAEPSQYNCLDDLLRTVPNTGKPSALVHVSGRRGAFPASDILSCLPIEVVLIVLAYLPSSSIKALRTSSRSLASVTHPGSLPQHFWKTRFSLEFEMGFALPTRTDGYQNWREAYFAIRKSLHDPQGSEKLKSRRRIWDIVSVNAALIERYLKASTPAGVSCPQIDYSDSEPGFYGVEWLSSQFVSAALSTNSHDLLHFGTRSMYGRQITLPFQEADLLTVGISTVEFNSRQFVAGIRFTLIDGTTGKQHTHSLGYVSAFKEQVIELFQQRMIGIDLAVCAGGIMGMRMVLSNAFHVSRTTWMGSASPDGVEVSFGNLCFGNEANQLRLVAEFDPYNLSYQQFNRYLNVDFGGVCGQRLPHLTRVVAHMLIQSAPIIGLQFYYDDQQPLKFGGQGLIEISFLVDGPGGERITSATFEQASTVHGIVSLQLQTNHGRKVVFMANELAGPYVADISPRLRLPGHKGIKYTKQTLQAPEGQGIVGFTSVLEASSGSFQTLGLQCEATGLRPTSAAELSTINTSRPSAELASSLGSQLAGEASKGCTGYTSATLHKVKRIRFSRGGEDRPRLSNEISGLWLEYSDTWQSAIVGQWISEDGGFDLADGEAITGIAFWSSKSRICHNERYPLGRLVRMEISTNLRCEMYPTVNTLSADEYTVLRFRENSIEILSQVVWAFNDAWDFVRIISTPKSTARDLILWHNTNYLEVYPWIVPEKAFWKLNDTDNLASITCFRHPAYQYTISGMQLTYQSGHTLDIGFVNPRHLSSQVPFQPDDTIDKIQLFATSRGLFDISFFCTNKQTEATTTRAFSDTASSHMAPGANDAPDGIDTHTIDIARRNYHYFSTAGYQREDQDIGEGVVVGLWGFDWAEKGLLVGLVLLQESCQMNECLITERE